jgi:hypothetical protein
MTESQHAIWLERIARYIDGTLTAEELKPLEDALRTDPTLRRVYLEYVNLDSALAATAALPEHEFAGLLDKPLDKPVERPTTGSRSTSRRRWASFAVGGMAVTAAVLLVVLLAPSPGVRADQTLREAEQALLLPVERGYAVEVRRATDDPDDTLSERRMRVWTHGDRFRVEVDQDNERWSWGRDPDGSVWVVDTPHRGLKINPDEIGPALQRLCDRYGLQPKSLLNDMLTGADLNQRPGEPTRKTVIVRGQFRSGFRRQWLESTELELDAATKVIQKFTVNRVGPDGEREMLTFTLTDTRPLDESLYRLEGYLTPPFEVLDRDSRPGRRRTILATRLGGGDHRWLITGKRP